MDKLFKNTKAMSWIALITFLLVVFFVTDQYNKKNGWGLFKKAVEPVK